MLEISRHPIDNLPRFKIVQTQNQPQKNKIKGGRWQNQTTKPLRALNICMLGVNSRKLCNRYSEISTGNTLLIIPSSFF